MGIETIIIVFGVVIAVATLAIAAKASRRSKSSPGKSKFQEDNK